METGPVYFLGQTLNEMPAQCYLCIFACVILPLDNAQKWALVQNLCHFFYTVEQSAVKVQMINIQTLDPGPSASYSSQLNAKSRAAKSWQASKQQSASSDRWEKATSGTHQSSLLAQLLGRSASAQDAKALPSDLNSVSGPRSLTVNNAQAPSQRPSTSSAALHAVSPERLLEIVPCAARTIGYYILSKAEKLKNFSDLNVTIMKRGQAKYGMALAEDLHK